MKYYIEINQVLNEINESCKIYYNNNIAREALKMVRKTICQLPAADVVDRDEGIRMGAELAAMHGSDATSKELEKAYFDGFEEAMNVRNVRPAVHGEWLWNDHNGYYYCEKCGSISPRENQDGDYIDCPNFCHNCGADMREPSKEERDG